MMKLTAFPIILLIVGVGIVYYNVSPTQSFAGLLRQDKNQVQCMTIVENPTAIPLIQNGNPRISTTECHAVRKCVFGLSFITDLFNQGLSHVGLADEVTITQRSTIGSSFEKAIIPEASSAAITTKACTPDSSVTIDLSRGGALLDTRTVNVQ